MVNAYSTRSVGVFFRRAKCFARESAMLKLQIRGRNEGSQRGGGEGGEKGGVSWCCGHYCLLAFVLWCGYCSVSFQSFVLRHWCPQHQETTEKGDGAREEKESIFPLPPFVSFALASNLRVAFSTLSSLPLSQNRKRRLQRNEHKQTAFSYACTAG